MTLRRSYITDAALSLLAFVAVVIPIATLVAAINPRRERSLLHYGFAHVPHEAAQALAILEANLSVLLPFLAMAILVQARGACATGGGRRAFVSFCDLVVAIPALHNLVLPVASSVGAYGLRMVIAMLPAGPIELTAFALAASVYLHSRRAQIAANQISQPARVATLATAILVLAAVTETYS